MAQTTSIIREFGAPKPAAALRVVESVGVNSLSDPRYGTTAFFGIMKRGPMGVAVPVHSRREYNEIFGDPTDAKWHLFAEGDHLTPDAVDSYFTSGGGAGFLFITRLDLEGKARKAFVDLKGRNGTPVLRIKAANEGRWGGAKNTIDWTTVVVASTRTFTVISPDLEANEMKGAIAEFSGASGKQYVVVANTAADPASGEAVFTVGAQYNLLTDGVTGPSELSGNAAYARYTSLTGSMEFPLLVNATGTATIEVGSTVITGDGTEFLSEFEVGDNVYYGGEARVVESITSDTTMTISAAFTGTGTGVTLQYSNVTVTGTTTAFDTELSVGDILYVDIDGARVGRTVAAINSATELVLSSGFPSALTAGTVAETDNVTVTGTDTAFDTEANVGQYIIDPNRSGESLKIVAINSPTELVVETPFSTSFSNASLAIQNQKATVYLSPGSNEGLSVVVGQGVRYPETHFSLDVYFNESNVLSISDASLDPADEEGLFVETLVSESNLAFRVGDTDITKWITAEVLWNSTYTTAKGSDVRPANGSGVALLVDATRLYTIADLDYSASVGQLLYPDPYSLPRSYVRVKSSKPVADLSGTVSSAGAIVSGTNTTFESELEVGDYLYDPNTDSVREVIVISDDTTLTLASPFPSDMPALTQAKVSGFLEVDRAYDLATMGSAGDVFLVQYPTSLEKGYDGDPAAVIPYHFTKFADVDRNHLENAAFGRNLGLIRMACPGISDVAIQKAFANYASAKAYEFRCEIPRQYNTASAAESFVINQLGRDDFISVAFPSYAYQSNPFGSGKRLIPLSGEIMGGESRKASTAEGWHDPFSGVTAILPTVLNLPWEPLPSDEAILNAAGIQAIKTVSGRAVVWGARIPSRSSVYNFLHIRRIQSNLVRTFLEAQPLIELLFRPNTPYLAEQGLLVLNNFARREYRKGVFTNYLTFRQAVTIDSLNPSASEVVTDDDTSDAIVAIVNGRLELKFSYVPTGIAEQLSIHVGPEILVAQYGK